MNPLAQHIYDCLKSLPVPRPAPGTITYGDLVHALQAAHPGAYNGLLPRHRRLHVALGQVVDHCHQSLHLPAASALVVNNVTGVPGDEYYPRAHPHLPQDDWPILATAWAAEVIAARSTTYP